SGLASLAAAGALLALALLSAGPATADVANDGIEFLVNGYTTGNQSLPRIASRGAEGFVIVWDDYRQITTRDDVFARLMNVRGDRVGAEFEVNTFTLGEQLESRVAAADTGEFVVIWSDGFLGDGSGYGVMGELYDSDGLPVGANFQVNSYTTGDQYHPDVAVDSSTGNFAVVWADYGRDGSGPGVFGRLFDSLGTAVGSEFQANIWTTGSQTTPRVAFDGSGGFVVSWLDNAGEDGSGQGVFARRIDDTGAPAGGEFQVNASTLGDQVLEGMAPLAGGGFVVTWHDASGLDGEGDGVFGRVFDSSGGAIGGQFQVNAYTSGDQNLSAVTAEPNGGFVVVWTGLYQRLDDFGIFGRQFDSAGAPRSAEFLVNSYTTGIQRAPTVAADSQGDFIVAWMDASGLDDDGAGIFARHFFGRAPALTSHSEGDLVDCSDPVSFQPTFTWDDDGYTRFRFWIASDPRFLEGTRTSSGKNWLKTTSWQPSKKKWKRMCYKALAISATNPTLYLRVQGKDPTLPKKDPARRRFSSTVSVSVTAGP
ncbi:MAG TPA: hypothetical protein VNI57_08535, partial [Candidatus Saccharimonadales bacterium]|nr:hypothetical protein [Candidatus Saccharimonadales bacterium]